MLKIKHIKNPSLHNFNCKTSPVFEKNGTYMCTQTTIWWMMRDPRYYVIVMDSWQAGKISVPYHPQIYWADTGHRLCPRISHLLRSIPSKYHRARPSVCFKTNLFGYLRGDSLLSDFCDIFFQGLGTQKWWVYDYISRC